MTEGEAKAIIEAALLAADKPLAVESLRAALDEYTVEQLTALIHQLRQDYVAQGRGMRLVEVAGGLQLVTDPAWAERLNRIYRKTRAARLSRPALETLAIIAYRQPVTRAEIEEIRGVNIDGVVQSLLERTLIQIVGRKEGVGRPLLYGTTPTFLERFGLKSLEGLPSLTELPPPEGWKPAGRPGVNPPAGTEV
ncbi:MAG: SMC-Scp complex subunit ScpB, partial [Candidatus Omnitrophica bacterium]|nr:SMC-Scp complex subunit ScpB [Candidatus Omnitrophota bacterium]